jgi:hypothetical protein
LPGWQINTLWCCKLVWMLHANTKEIETKEMDFLW